MLCDNCKAAIPTLKTRLAHVNQALWALGTRYHDFLPFELIDAILNSNGFFEIDNFDRKGQTCTSIQSYVGDDKWLHVSWYKMDSGRYEVTAYVN